MPNEIGIDIDITGANDLKTVGLLGKRAGDDVGEGLKKGFKDGQEASDRASASIKADMSQVERYGKDAGQGIQSGFGEAFDKVRREASQTADDLSSSGRRGGDLFASGLSDAATGSFDIGSMIEGFTGGAGGAWAAAGAAVGGSIAMAEWEAINAYFDQRSLGGVIAAQQGAASSAAGKLGHVAGDSYYNGFAESVEKGGEALSGVLGKGLIDTDAAEADIQELTDIAATAAQVTGRSAEEVSGAVRVMLHTGLVSSAKEGFDLIVAGAQRGADAGGDLVDVLTQSAVNLERFGLTGAQSVGILKQALDAGAPSADAFTGALEELVGNASDGIPVFQQLGLGGQEFADALAGGGPRAAQALDKLLDRIRAIESPAQRSAVMVQLFGEEATALQDAILAVDPSTAAESMKDFAGSTKNAAQTISDSQSPIEKLGRGIEQIANVAVGGMDAMSGGADQVEKHFDKATDKTFDFRNASEKLADAQEAARDAIAELDGTASSYARTLEEIISSQEQLAGDFADAEHAQLGYQEAIDAANEALATNKQNTDISTEAGRNNKEALLDLSDAAWKVVEGLENQGATAQEVQGFMGSARDQFVATAISMGYGADEANRMADKLHLIPGDYNARVRADTAGANSALDFTLAKLRAAAQVYTASVQVRTSGTGILGQLGIIGRAHGGVTGAADLWGAATGGARHSSTVMNEEGPEVAELPNGSIVATAGATRALAESGAFSGGGGATQVVLSLANTDDLGKAILKSLRVEIKNSHGGSAVAALSQRGVT